MKYSSAVELTDEIINLMESDELLKNCELVYDTDDEIWREHLKLQFLARAKLTGDAKTIKSTFAVYDKALKKRESDARALRRESTEEIELERDEKGAPLQTGANILQIMRSDPLYSGVRYNVLSNRAEVLVDGLPRAWSDTDLSKSNIYIEQKYKIYSKDKHRFAFNTLLSERQHHPIIDVLDCFEWDGEERIPHFLTKWAKTDDTPYTREVSRLIFAGGINRLYNPGCKFDDVPILVGTRQGEGKSSLIRFLAIQDDFYSEVKQVEGKEAVEQLDGAWICEIPELAAFTKVKEIEAIKAYVTRQSDKYRKPYAENAEEHPRRCIFIGTTNQSEFLSDKSGNRRFYPVTVNSNGYWLYEHELECRDYIVQCWAEAREKFKAGKMPAFADPLLVDEYRKVQANAMEDDWRVGVIEAYLDRFNVGDTVCVRMIAHEALSVNSDFPTNPTPKESREIGQIIRNIGGWEQLDKAVRQGKHGPQKSWIKTVDTSGNLTDELPFVT